jgi:hypothetical protein
MLLFLPSSLCADDFYKGKTIRVIVGGSAGGGFDIYTRAMARHMGKHIPGNPSLVVENMTGAGTFIAAKYLHSSAKPDGPSMAYSSLILPWSPSLLVFLPSSNRKELLSTESRENDENSTIDIARVHAADAAVIRKSNRLQRTKFRSETRKESA